MEREAFAHPADEEPCAAEEYEELECPVNGGIGRCVLPDPFLVQLVRALVNPAGIEDDEGQDPEVHQDEAHSPDVRQDDVGEPLARAVQREEHFPWRHHDSHVCVMREEDEGAEGKETHGYEADEDRQFPSHDDAADDVHDEEDQEQDRDRCQEVRAQVVEGGVLQSVHRVQEYVRKYDYP